VTDKDKILHGGDRRDYVSQAPYWWPDPSKPDGLPYIKHDGKENPEIYQSDRVRIEALCDAVSSLTLQAQVADSQTYAEHAGRFLHRWFLDEKTGMLPHLRYAQFIPGICEGRGIGIIDTSAFCFMLDEIQQIPFTSAWSPEDLESLKGWFGSYLDWLLESDHGKTEAHEHNNHGTWYDAQVVCFALFCGRRDTARQWLEDHSRERIVVQIEADGRQPHELERTLSLNYCTFNLNAFVFLARMGSSLGLDLWGQKGPGGSGVLTALHWMLPYYLGLESWRWAQIKEFKMESASYLLHVAAQGSGDQEIQAAADQITVHPWERLSMWGGSLRSFDWASASFLKK
jgi:hypothetical protein